MRLAARFFVAALLLLPAVAQGETDHLAGVIVKDLDKIQPPASYSVETELGTVTCELKKAKFLLLPSEKNGGDDPRGTDPGKLVCYTAKCTDLAEGTSELDDQFGAHTLDRKKVKLVCAPANENPCGNGVVDGGETCDGTDDDACPGLCAADCTCPAPACGNNVTEGAEACDGTDDEDCPGLCQVDCTCGTPPPDVCCQFATSCTGGTTASTCTAQLGTPGTAGEFCGNSGECSATDAFPAGCCQYASPLECQMPISQLDCEGNSGTYVQGTICSETGECIAPKIVFATSTTHDGNLGGLSGADAICQSRAASQSIAGTFRAWLSTPTTSADARLTHSTTPYILRNSAVVAADWDDLTDGTLNWPINLTETLVVLPAASAWSASTASGSYASTAGSCMDWTSNFGANNAVFGDVQSTSATWTIQSFGACSQARHLYCIQQ